MVSVASKSSIVIEASGEFVEVTRFGTREILRTNGRGGFQSCRDSRQKPRDSSDSPRIVVDHLDGEPTAFGEKPLPFLLAPHSRNARCHIAPILATAR